MTAEAYGTSSSSTVTNLFLKLSGIINLTALCNYTVQVAGVALLIQTLSLKHSFDMPFVIVLVLNWSCIGVFQ